MSMHARAIDERLARRVDTPASEQRLRGHRLFGSVSDIECMLFSQISSSNAANTAERRPRMHKTDSAEGAKGKNRT
ncbi:hypothetical protein [Palleronia pelagia]|uniref:Uncharacterized protein n=1 Tax=Palleronia pelagia TaxID=387096 RepID=A0A1H8ICF8_9RHOB|nr:hypothetical protein [Palleronia pelagia]SEN66134.1 hypothetical protein SAMN04488011_105183 [Palleronia pelagia]